MSEKACIVYHDMVTAYGHGAACCLAGLFENRSCFSSITRFRTDAETPFRAACFSEELFPGKEDDHIAERAIGCLLEEMMRKEIFISENAMIFFALTQGEISELHNPENIWTAKVLENRILKRFFPKHRSKIFSASCASGNIALARAAYEIESGHAEQVIVIGCDVVSEFTFAGFSSVHALTSDLCRPYDMAHDGLLLGDAAGVMVLTSEKKAREKDCHIQAVIAGYGITTDAYHAAAPDPQGWQMARAVQKVIDQYPENRIAGVIGHGTGTKLNDDMEIAALNSIFPHGVPLASIKGGTGHILAASGIIQASCAIGCLRQAQLFPQTALTVPQPGAEKFVSDKCQRLDGNTILSLNAGFGGLNAVLGIRRY